MSTGTFDVKHPGSRVRRRRLLPGRRGLRHLALIVVGFAASVMVWWAAAAVYDSPLLFPDPVDVYHQFGVLIGNGTLAGAVSASLVRAITGLIIGSIAGVALGLLSGSSRILEALFEPFINIFRFIPPLAWYAPVLLWLGTGESAKVALIVYTSIFVVAVNTAAGVKAVPPNKVRMASTFGARWWQVFFLIRLPASAPYIFAGVRIAIGNAFMTVVTAELLGAPEGLGVIITTGMATTNLPNVFVALITLGALGLLADRALALMLRRFGPRLGATPPARR